MLQKWRFWWGRGRLRKQVLVHLSKTKQEKRMMFVVGKANPRCGKIVCCTDHLPVYCTHAYIYGEFYEYVCTDVRTCMCFVFHRFAKAGVAVDGFVLMILRAAVWFVFYTRLCRGYSCSGWVFSDQSLYVLLHGLCLAPSFVRTGRWMQRADVCS